MACGCSKGKTAEEKEAERQALAQKRREQRLLALQRRELQKVSK